jgi:hypothetical protein
MVLSLADGQGLILLVRRLHGSIVLNGLAVVMAILARKPQQNQMDL